MPPAPRLNPPPEYEGRRQEAASRIYWQTQKIQNHGHAIALYFMHYNFCKIHSTLRVTPATEAKLTDHVWEVEEPLALAG